MKAQTLMAILTGILAIQVCLAQTSNQGAIVGTVRDPSGAIIPSAQVAATNRDTGVSSSTRTNGVGEYRLNFLVPGNYDLAVNAAGFQKTQIENVVVTVGQLLRTDIKMKVGTQSQEVTVSGSAAPLNVDTASRGEVIESEAVKNLPLNGREWIQLATLVPGAVSGNVKRGTYTDKGVEVSFNGARDTYNSYYVDGADSTDAYHNTLISSPSLDAIKEFRVETNMFSAQYGRSGGATIMAVTKSGGNTYHGSLYEYHRNKFLDARPAFAMQPKSQLPNYLFNQFGGSFGGAIVKNKAFFFFSMEKFRQVSPGNLIVGFAPTAAEASGDVSHTMNPYSNQPVVLKNPLTGEVIPSGILPANLISPIGKTLMDIWSQFKPNYNDPFLNLRYFRAGHNRQDKYLPRIDYNINSNNSIFGTFDWDDYNTTQVANTIYGDTLYKEHDKTITGTYTHTFTPTLVNDFKVSRTWDTQGADFVLNDQSYAQKWGFYGPLNQGLGSPRILMYTQGQTVFQIGGTNLYHNQHTLFLRDDLVWVKGKSTIHFGGDFRRQNFLWQAYSGQTQDYFGLDDGLASVATTYGETGSTFTDLLTAMPNEIGIGGGGGKLMPFSRNAFAGYIQEDWKVSSRLTLNLGVRYDYEAPFAVDNGQFLGLDFDTGLPRYCKDAPRDLLSIMQFKYEVGGECRDHTPDYHDFSPRVGFAFQPFGNGSTVIRGGYGLFYTSENAYNSTYGSWVQPFAGIYYWYAGSAKWQQPKNRPINPLLDGQSHFTTLDQKPYGVEYVQGQSMGFFQPTSPYYPTAYVEQYNLTLGQQFGSSIVTELAYVGSRGVNLNGPSTTNNYDPTLLPKIQAQNPQIANFGIRVKGFNSFYNALQASARKSMSHGIYFIAAYTWSHALTDMSNDDTNETLFSDTTQAGTIIEKRLANADFDYRQRFSFSGVWQLPFGRGQAFGSTWNPVLNNILGGWQVSPIILYQGGFPFTVYDASLHFPDRICDGSLPHPTATKWFDISCFPTHVGTVITDPVTGAKKTINIQGNSPPNAMRGPGTENWDISMGKNFRVKERVNIEFRGEFFNTFNHVNLQAPSGNYFINTVSGEQITRAASRRDIQLALRLTF